MIKIELTLSNDAAGAAEKEVAAFLARETERMGSPKDGVSHQATQTYAVLRPLLNQLRGHRKALEEANAAEAKERREKALRNRPPVTQERSR